MKAVPHLIKRIADLHAGTSPVQTSTVLASRGDFQKEREVGKLVRTAAIRLQGQGGILIVFDSDGVCPATLGPQVLAWARTVAGNLPVGLVVAHHEYEAWILAGARTLSGVAGLRRKLRPPNNPEALSDPKRWLSENLVGEQRYSPTRHQLALTKRFDLGDARTRASSFDKCYREIARLVAALTHPGPNPTPP